MATLPKTLRVSLIRLQTPASQVVAECFLPGKIYYALYDIEATPPGWFTMDEGQSIHWLTPPDKHPHLDIMKEQFVLMNFRVVTHT